MSAPAHFDGRAWVGTPTREQAMQGAAEVLVDAAIRIETERAIASAQKNAPDAEQGVEGEIEPTLTKETT